MLTSFIVTWIVTALSLLIISRLDVGIGVGDTSNALIIALIFGLINASLGYLPLTPDAMTLSLVSLVVNALLFWGVSMVVKGFWLKHGFWSALLGSVLLTVINAVLFWVLGQV